MKLALLEKEDGREVPSTGNFLKFCIFYDCMLNKQNPLLWKTATSFTKVSPQKTSCSIKSLLSQSSTHLPPDMPWKKNVFTENTKEKVFDLSDIVGCIILSKTWIPQNPNLWEDFSFCTDIYFSLVQCFYPFNSKTALWIP